MVERLPTEPPGANARLPCIVFDFVTRGLPGLAPSAAATVGQVSNTTV